MNFLPSMNLLNWGLAKVKLDIKARRPSTRNYHLPWLHRIMTVDSPRMPLSLPNTMQYAS